MNKFKIGFITPIYPPDNAGMANLVFYKNSWLREKGIETKVITFTPRDSDIIPAEYDHENVFRYRPFFRRPAKSRAHLLKDALALLSALHRELKRCDIIEIHGFSLFNPCLHLIRKFLKSKKVIHVYKGNDGWLYNDKKIVNFRRWMNPYTYTVTNSFALKKHLEQKNIRVHEVIWSEADPNIFSPDITMKDENTLITVKGLYTNSGINFALDALNILQKTAAFKYMIIGDGPKKSEYVRQCEKMNLSDKVIFLGNVPHRRVADYLKKASIKILTSLRESCPHVMVEAMMSGKPCITHPVDDVNEILKESQAGMVVNHGNAKELSDAIFMLLNDHTIRNKMGANARKFALANLSTEVIFSKYLKIYNKL